MLKLIISSLKQLFRNKEAVFWLFLFPLLFIVVFKLFGFGGSANAHIIVIDNSKNDTIQMPDPNDSSKMVDVDVTKMIIEQLQSIKGVGINTSYTDLEEAKKVLRNSDDIEFRFQDDKTKEIKNDKSQVNVILVFPENYANFSLIQNYIPTSGNTNDGEILAANESTSIDKSQFEAPFKVELYYNQSDEGVASPSGIVDSILNSITNNIMFTYMDTPNLFGSSRNGVAVNEIKYYDILVPGIIAMGLMQSGIIGMASEIAALKEKKILKRLSATPLAIWKFVLAEVLTYITVSMVQTTIMLVVAKFLLGANIYGSIPLVYFLAFISSFVFLLFGFIAAALTNTANAASSLSNVMTMPMMFLSGVFFTRDTLPKAVKVIADYLPLSPLIDALRAVMLQNKGITDLGNEFLIMGIWTVTTFLIAARVFKFRQE